MKTKLTALFLLLCILTSCLFACGDDAWFTPRYEDYVDEVTLPNYADLTLDTAKIETLVADEIAAILNSWGETYYSAGTLALTDIAIIDCVGVLAGETEPFEGGSYEDMQVQLGAGDAFDGIPGFDDGLVGKQVGETVTLNLTFPADYFETALQNKAVTFTVTINGFYRMETPTSFTDEMAAQITRGELSTAEAYRDYLETYYREVTAFDQVLEAAEIDKYPSRPLNTIRDEMYAKINGPYSSNPNSYKGYGIETFEDYLASVFCESAHGRTFASLDELEDYLIDSAKTELKKELVLTAIIVEQNFVLTEENYVTEANKIAKGYGLLSYEELINENFYTEEELCHQILFEQVYTFLGTALQ